MQRRPAVRLLAASERRAFDSLRTRLIATLDSRLSETRVADATATTAPARATSSAGVSPAGSGM
jgi:hypothetical protein